MVVAPTTSSAADKPPAAQDSAAAGNGKEGDAGNAGGKKGRKRKASSALAAASEGGSSGSSSGSSTDGGTASSWPNEGAKRAEVDAGGDDGNAAIEGGGAEKTTGDGDGDGERDASNKGPKKKKRRGQGKKKRAAEARAAAAAAAAAVAAAGSASSLGDAGGSTTAAAVDDAGGPGAPPPPASLTAVGQKQQQQQKQHQHAGEQTAEAAAAVSEKGKTQPETTTKKKKKRKKKKKARGEDEDGKEAAEVEQKKSERDWELGAEEAAKMAPWMYLGVELHPALLWHLHRQGFHDPTPIQRRVLPKAVLGRKDIIGAAETGSGKTLAFGLPVLSEILTRRDAAAAAATAAAAKSDEGGEADQREGEEKEREGLHEGLQALVLCPTRELALQVAAHLREVVRDTGVAVVAVVGGLAEVKQQRQLSRRPEVVVATPGRFWEMAGTHAHLSRLETLRHLVVDEADRMLERGHYPELSRLFSMLAKAEGRREGGDGGSSSKSRFEEKFPFDVSEGGEWSVPQEEEEEDSGEGGKMFDDAMDESGDGDGGADGGGLSGGASRVRSPPAETNRHDGRGFARQTYVFSATLTLGSSGRQQRKKGGAGGAAAKGKGKRGEGDDDAVKNIMDRVGVRGDPAVIDMGRRTVGGGGGAETGQDAAAAGPAVVDGGAGAGAADLPALPSTLKLCSIKSLQMEKDVHAYLFCAMYPGRTLIFVNAIAIARRLSALLCALNVPATPLHAQMQQRQRLKSLDRFTSDPKAVLVATDVAARGLDIPKVEHVVHYDAARSAEVFIHRAGRTARARAAGLSLSIVAPRDDANHRQTCSVLGLHGGMQAFPLDVRMVERARERVGMALRVLKFQEAQNRVSASNDFFRGLSKEADLVMDGDLLMEDAGAKPDAAAQGRRGVKGLGKKGNQHAARLAAEARQALAVSLSQPLHSDRRKLIPVAQALTDMRAVSERTAAGDLAGKQRTSSGKQKTLK
ncbi:unnamed protein product [Ectocarpus sp. CCAP 1310/34]|nr:unnamed protein product [Ectocarpus sp. CCAP 1310/34]